MLFVERHSKFDGTSNNDYGIVQWNSSEPDFHLKIVLFFSSCSCINHGVRYNPLSEHAQLSKGLFC